MRIDLDSPVDVLGFRAHANSMLAHQVLPADIAWQALASRACGETMQAPAIRPPSLPSALHAIVPRSFVRLTELVVLHRDLGRFDLLYRLLWRLVHEPELASSSHDGDMALAQSMAQAVRRDILRARKSLHLRALAPHDGASLRFAWCEPQHHVTEEVGQALSRAEPDGPWLLASPDRCLLWTGDALLCGPGVPTVLGHSATDDDWYALAESITHGTH